MKENVNIKRNAVIVIKTATLDFLRFFFFWNEGNQLGKYPYVNPLNPELNPICYLLALLAHCFLHVSRIRVKLLTLRLIMSYIYIYI